MRIAYLILAHNTPNHMKRLVRALDSANSTFFIHVDRKSDISSFRNGLLQSNIMFLEDRLPLYWGEFPIVPASFKLIREAMTLSPQPEYLCLLSGSDYPLRSREYIEEFFSRNHGHEFINLVQMPCDAMGKPIERLELYWLQTPYNSRYVTRLIDRLNQLNRRLKLIRRDYAKVFNGLNPCGGSTWWALTREACQYILDFIETRPEVLKFYSKTYMPDESIFQTIVGNSEFAKNVVRNLTFTDWSRPTGGPAIIDMDHLRAFVEAKDIVGDDAYGRGELLFARKFPDDSSTLTDFIDTYLIHRRGFAKLAPKS